MRIIILTTAILLIVMVLLGGSYTWWNAASPERTCASCHEISPSVTHWQYSAHRNMNCTECHGTALGNGLHSLKEKANMVFTHAGGNMDPEDIHMPEISVLAVMEECVRCHQAEHAKWLSGGHSATYERIFLDEQHNHMEAPYWDCFRCHGMYYDGSIYDLMDFPGSSEGEWRMKDTEKGSDPAIPCLSCHQIHSENLPLQVFDAAHGRSKGYGNPTVSWYIRNDRRHIRTDHLQPVRIFHEGRKIRVNDDPSNKLCLQCHSPDFSHTALSEDDRTPTGVHEGISCNGCHEPHSNSTRNACKTCHPGISDCKVDVMSLDLSDLSIDNPYNIHRITCTVCHPGY